MDPNLKKQCFLHN
jgi:B-box zinc finger